jgi:two-component system chemotaxis response regulator CheY
VDDSAVFRKVLGLQLKAAGYTIEEAIDGIDAFNKVSTQEFSLVVCDVNMPNMDGLTFVGKVRAQDKTKFLPIVMLTTESQEEKKKKGMEAGAKAWLVKPFSPEQLLNAISKLIL